MRRFRHAGSTVIEPIPNGGLEGFKGSCLAAWDAKPVILNGGMGCHASQSDLEVKTVGIRSRLAD